MLNEIKKPIRLYPDEKKALFDAIKDVDGEVYIFGSRTYPDKKGGDIDILIYSKQNPLKLSQEISIKFFNELDSKLDVVVFDKSNITKEQKAFIKTLNLIRIK